MVAPTLIKSRRFISIPASLKKSEKTPSFQFVFIQLPYATTSPPSCRFPASVIGLVSFVWLAMETV
jgi:hypothetical protein